MDMLENPQEFLRDVEEIMSAFREGGLKTAEPLVAKFKEKFDRGAFAIKGSECAGCTSCAGCAICGPSAIQAIQLGHGLRVFHLD